VSALAVEDVAIAFGGVAAVAGVSFAVAPGEIFAIIGPNGAGKTTLFNIIAGNYRPSRGRIALHGDDVTGDPPHLLARRGLSRTFQNLQIFFRMTAAENVMVGRHLHERRALLPQLFALPSVLRQNTETRRKAVDLLAFVGLSALADQPAGNMPYGALKRLEIARALATEPKVLLLDEPAAGVPHDESVKILDAIDRLPPDIAVLMIEHDMDLVFKFAKRVLVLASGRLIFEGSPREVTSDAEVRRAYFGNYADARRAS
jgi:branched-chain amino acid transport system ATP-binding protein